MRRTRYGPRLQGRDRARKRDRRDGFQSTFPVTIGVLLTPCSSVSSGRSRRFALISGLLIRAAAHPHALKRIAAAVLMLEELVRCVLGYVLWSTDLPRIAASRFDARWIEGANQQMKRLLAFAIAFGSCRRCGRGLLGADSSRNGHDIGQTRKVFHEFSWKGVQDGASAVCAPRELVTRTSPTTSRHPELRRPEVRHHRHRRISSLGRRRWQQRS